MARAIQTTPRQHRRALVPPMVTLALWRARHTWRLLLVIGLGMVTADVLVCAGPLFSQIAMTAGLSGVLTSSPQASELALEATAVGLSSSAIAQEEEALASFLQPRLGPILKVRPRNSSFRSLTPRSLPSPLSLAIRST